MADLVDAILAALDVKSDDAYWIYRDTVEALSDLHASTPTVEHENVYAADGSFRMTRPKITYRCRSCVADVSVEYSSPVNEPYPCPTVRAIAEKLGVEVRDG